MVGERPRFVKRMGHRYTGNVPVMGGRLGPLLQFCMPTTRLISGLRAAIRAPLLTTWFALCAFLVVSSFGVIAWVVWPQRAADQVFPIHYTIYFGIDRVGPWWQVFLPAYVAAGVFLANLVAASAFGPREPLVSRLVAALTLPLLALLFAASIFVALLNVP